MMVLKVIPVGAKNSESVKWWARLLRSKNEAFRLKIYILSIPSSTFRNEDKLNVGTFYAH